MVRCQKNGKKSMVHRPRKMAKNQRSAENEKWQKIIGPWAGDKSKNQRSARKKKQQNNRTADREKWKKLKGPQSKKNGKKLKVIGQRKMARNQRSAVKENAK